MEKDNKIILGALLILFAGMVSFNLNSITGKQVSDGLPDFTAEAYFTDLDTGEVIRSAPIGKKADIQVKIKNEGTGVAPAGDKSERVTHRFWIKVDRENLEEKNLKNKIFYLRSALKPGDYAIKTLRQITNGFDEFLFSKPGKHCITVKLDTGKKIGELNEDNDFENLGCVDVYEEGKEPVAKEETTLKTTAKKTKPKKVLPTSVTLKLLQYHRDEGEYVEVLLDEKVCELSGGIGVSCSFKTELLGPSASLGERKTTDYVVRAFTSTDSWKVRHVRVLDSANKVFLNKPCSAYSCELKSGEMLKTETKDKQFITSGEYTIETIAELS